MNVAVPMLKFLKLRSCKHIYVLMSFLVFFLLTSAPECKIIDRIIAVINDDIITLKELNSLAKPFEDKIIAANLTEEREKKTINKMKTELLEKMIYEILGRQEAERVGIVVSEESIDQAIGYIMNTKGMTEADLMLEIESEGLTFEKFRQNIEFQIMKPKLINKIIESKVVITDSEIETYYIENDEKYAGNVKYRLRNIIIRTTSYMSNQEKDDLKNNMEVIYEKLEEGVSFADLAKEYSQSPQSSDGGDLGFFEYKELSSFLKDELKGKGPGFTTPIIMTEHGYQIFYIEDKIEGNRILLEDVSDDISKRLHDKKMEEKYEQWVSDVREKSYIKILY